MSPARITTCRWRASDKVENWENNPIVPNAFLDEKNLDLVSGFSFGDALGAALEANAEALEANNRFSAKITLPKLDMYFLGALMYMLALSIAYEGELANVNAFNQPGVEAYKKILKEKLKNIK